MMSHGDSRVGERVPEGSSMTSGLQIVGGLVLLIGGADVLVRAGTGLASWLRVRPMMIGLTVVSLETSMPELAVGIDVPPLAQRQADQAGRDHPVAGRGRLHRRSGAGQPPGGRRPGGG